MALPLDNCVAWWKFENVNDEIGGFNFTDSGVTFGAGKFNNGAYTNTNGKYLNVVNAMPSPTKFALEFWLKTDWSIANGHASSNDHSYFVWRYDANNRIYFYSMTGFTGLEGKASGTNFGYYQNSGDLTWAAGLPFNHFLIVVDRGGIDGGADIVRWYLNGVLVYNSTAALPAAAASTGYFRLMALDEAYGYNFGGMLDNAKLYNDTTQALIDAIIANKDIEGFPSTLPVVPTNLTASDGAYTTHVVISWDTDPLNDEYNLYRSADGIVYTELSGWQAAALYNDTTAIPGTVYYYKVKAKNTEGISAFSAVDDGYRAEVAEPVGRKPKILILNSGIDLYALGYAQKFGKVIESKQFQQSKITVDDISIPLINIDNKFNPDNPSSILARMNWRYQPIKKYNEENVLIWEGVIDDFDGDQNSKITNLLGRSSLVKYFSTKTEYTSTDWETPAEAFKNICDTYEIAYNQKSIDDSIAVYQANSCYIKCAYVLTDGVTVQSALEAIAKTAGAVCYTHLNIMYFRAWSPFTGGVICTLEESDLSKKIKSKLSRLYYNNYVIGYYGDLDVPAKDTDNNNIGAVSRLKNDTSMDAQIDGTDGQQIIIKDLTSAVYIGEVHIRRTHVNLTTAPFPPRIIDFTLPYKFKDFFTLTSYFKINNTPLGWTGKIFEVEKIERDYDNRIVDINAIEVDE